MLLQDGTTPLYVACQNGHETVVKLLLDGGSDVNKATDVSNISQAADVSCFRVICFNLSPKGYVVSCRVHGTLITESIRKYTGGSTHV